VSKTEPKYVFHYTSIDTLEKIITTKSIKFNRLDLVNDNNEGKSLDFGNLGIYIYVSCWTDEEKENIPLWTMYTKDGTGARIKFPTKMFKFYPIQSRPDISFFAEPGLLYPKKFEDLHGPDYLLGPIPEKFPAEVIYTNDFRKIIPRVADSFERNLIHLGKLGAYKREEWFYEKEWRFMIRVMPAPPPPKKSYAEYKDSWSDLTNKQFFKRKISIKSIFLDLNENALQNCEIMIGPKCDEKMVKKISDILQKNNVKANIVDSSLKGQIK